MKRDLSILSEVSRIATTAAPYADASTPAGLAITEILKALTPKGRADRRWSLERRLNHSRRMRAVAAARRSGR